MMTNAYDEHRPQMAEAHEEVTPNVEPGSRKHAGLVPEAVEASATARRTALGNEMADVEFAMDGEPAAALSAVRARGVDWVRPTDLIARHSGTVAGRGLDLQAELSRRMHSGIASGARAVGEQARRLPPLSSFGRGSRHQPPTRAAVGTA